MNVRHERRLEVEVGPEELRERAAEWAGRSGFRLERDEPGRLVYGRGSRWAALYTFDYRKVPTRATVEMDGRQVRCTLHCRSWAQVVGSNDSYNLLCELELLVAYLGSA
jgi:hypothetical protein